MKSKHIVGKRFGRLTVIQQNGLWPWCICRCDCGKEKKVLKSNIVNGYTRSCGCFHRERTIEANTVHGKTHTPEYKVWTGIKQRCTNPNAPHYECYGGRGISMCKRWMVFSNFFQDMGKRPTNKHSIDRRNNSLGYSPSNCVWATKQDQMDNRRSNRNITMLGETHCLSYWCKKFGRPVRQVNARINRLGWNPKTAILEPIKQKKGK